ncbi:phage head completion protein [Streptomyces catenulae]|uniref:Phage head-tail adapter protein n=1 Tax=Streptomyces catenulae TaxID=66875 RepID=A0ABV2YTE0_9ACTN|nr:phage head-tail adapter protein [Streptomyces catenulae]
MVSVQRRRGQRARVWRTVEVVDNRGNTVITPSPDGPIEVRAAFIPQRSSRAEVPGQQQINVTTMIVDAAVDDVSLWSRVEYNGREWDIASPPAYHHGDRRTRHWSIDLRERP